MRGSAEGTYEAAHALRDGSFWKNAGTAVDTKEDYDLVVVGAGLSGLSAAHFYRKRHPAARVLILDNHDDFGGHATRNEFRPGGRLLLGNGGTWAIESPFPYSSVADGLMKELGIDPPALAEKCEVKGVHDGLNSAYFFDKETFGADRLVVGGPSRRWREGSEDWKSFLARTPLSPAVQRDILRLHQAQVDLMPGLTSEQKKDRLSRLSYRDFLVQLWKVDAGVVPFFQADTHGLYGVGVDAVCALDCWVLGLPGFECLGLEPGPHPRMGFTARGYATPKPEYTFHFPDGNASLARLLVRGLVPGAIPGGTVEDVVTAKADYEHLDREGGVVRIRLGSTATRVRHVGDPRAAERVEVSYAREGGVYAVRGRDVVLACWNMVIPDLCPELPEAQRQALRYATKVPLVYTSVAVRSWRAWKTLGIQGVSCPGMYHSELSLDRAVNVGDYRAPASPDEPILVRMTRTPCQPGQPEMEQNRAGRYDLLSTPFETFERSIRDQLQRVLGTGGFDAARDIDAITVNRWPHGYAHEYNALFEPEWPEGQRPCEVGRRRFGRVAIANSDAAARAYTDSAIDEAHRAVEELLTL
jgi:spermidine dehydrogenase